MSNPRDKVAEAICGTTSAGKLFPWSESTEANREPWRRMADAAIAAHLVELGQGGYVVVKLPEPKHFPRHQESVWDVDESSVIINRWNQVSIDLDDWEDEGPTPAEMRGLAAALLSAAEKAEASR